MDPKPDVTRKTIRIGKYLNEVITIRDHGGSVLYKVAKPLMVEFYFRDVIQIIIGATILAIPVGFTEEVWMLGAMLPWTNILAILIVSILFISLFVYYNYYRKSFRQHSGEFIKRVVFTYLLSILVVSFLLMIIQQGGWVTSWEIALKRTILIALPASMSAAVADTIR